MHAMICMWGSEDILQAPVLSYHESQELDSGPQVYSKCRYALSHLTDLHPLALLMS